MRNSFTTEKILESLHDVSMSKFSEKDDPLPQRKLSGSSSSLRTTFAHTNFGEGVLFQVTAKQDISIVSLDVSFRVPGVHPVTVSTTESTKVKHETILRTSILVDFASQTSDKLPQFATPVDMTAGSSRWFYVYSASAKPYVTLGQNFGAVYCQNNDLSISEGYAMASGVIAYPYLFNGVVRYNKGLTPPQPTELVKEGWTDYINDWDDELLASFRWNGGEAAICGVASYHRDSKEDRRFKFKYCFPKDYSGQTVITGSSSYTKFDDHFSYRCPPNSFISTIHSYHSNSKEDRTFKFTCGSFAGHELDRSDNTRGWVNDYDDYFEFDAPDGTVITGVESIHSNSKEDRLFKFYVHRVVS